MSIRVAKGKRVKRGVVSKTQKKKGCSSFGDYKNVSPKDFAGRKADGNCDFTFPINTKARARSALGRAHFAKNPSAIRRRVFQKYPSLLKGSEFTKSGRRRKKR